MGQLDDKGLSWIRQYLEKSGSGAPARETSQAQTAVVDAPTDTANADATKLSSPADSSPVNAGPVDGSPLPIDNVSADSKQPRGDFKKVPVGRIAPTDGQGGVESERADIFVDFVTGNVSEQVSIYEVVNSPDYVNNNIVDLKGILDKDRAFTERPKILEMKVIYKNGNFVKVPMQLVRRSVGAQAKRYWRKEKGSIIYPVTKGTDAIFDKINASNIILCADWLEAELSRQLALNLKVIELGATFAKILKMNTAGLGAKPKGHPPVGSRTPYRPNFSGPKPGGGGGTGGTQGGGAPNTGTPKGGTPNTGTPKGGGGDELPTTPMRLPDSKTPATPGKGPTGTIVSNPPPPPAKPPGRPGGPGGTPRNTQVGNPPPMPTQQPRNPNAPVAPPPVAQANAPVLPADVIAIYRTTPSQITYTMSTQAHQAIWANLGNRGQAPIAFRQDGSVRVDVQRWPQNRLGEIGLRLRETPIVVSRPGGSGPPAPQIELVNTNPGTPPPNPRAPTVPGPPPAPPAKPTPPPAKTPPPKADSAVVSTPPAPKPPGQKPPPALPKGDAVSPQLAHQMAREGKQVHESSSPQSHQQAWESLGRQGPAPIAFIRDKQVYIDMSRWPKDMPLPATTPPRGGPKVVPPKK